MNGDDIYVLDANRELTTLRSTPYESEALLQELLEHYPDLLAGGQMHAREPRRWLLIAREFGVPDQQDAGNRWSLDHLFVDQDGLPTLVEVKRSSDTRIRREVIGQMLDYAANGVRYWPPEMLRSRFVQTAGGDEGRADELVETFAAGGLSADEFWQAVGDHLQSGRMRLLFVADVIPSELRRVIEFLNEQMTRVEVLGVEVRQYVGGDLRTLVPRVIGHTATAEATKGRATSRSYDEWLADADPFTLDVARSLTAWAASEGLETRTTASSLQLLAAPGRPMANFYPRWKSIDVALDPLRSRGQGAQAESVLASIASLVGKVPGDKYPNLPCAVVAEHWDRFRAEVLEPTLSAYRAAGGH